MHTAPIALMRLLLCFALVSGQWLTRSGDLVTGTIKSSVHRPVRQSNLRKIVDTIKYVQ